MEVAKPNTRTRKVINYAAMNGDRSSDDSDNDFVVNTKVSKPSATASKPSKLSKLKLGSRKETKLSNKSKFTELKPISDQSTKAIQPPIIAGSKIVEEIDFSIAEPDLIIHSISSQDTVIASTCECLSPHELSDSSDSEICGTTFELSATVKNMCQKHESKKKIVSEDEDEDFKPLKTNEERITKRRIISESDTAKNKKIKIESKEDEKLNTRGSVESITKLSVDDSEDTSLPLLPRLSPCTKMVERSLPEQLIQNCQNLVLVASINEDSELPVALENNIHTSVKEKIKVSKDDHKLEKAEEYPRISALQHISEDSNKIRPVSAEAVSPTKTAKKATKVLKQKLQLKKKPETNSKRDVTNLKQCRDESCDSSKPTGIIHSTIVDNGLPKNDELGGFEAVPSKNTQITQDPVHIFKPPSPPLRVAVKWKPPGKAGGGANIFSNGNSNSPSTGIRLGLSRNRRASKPLHPDVKVKI